MQGNKHSILVNLSLLFVSAGIIVFISEMFLVIFHPIYPSIYIPDNKLLFKLATDGKKVYRGDLSNGENKILIKTNSLGYRGEELRHSHKRIVVYGDSFIEAEFSELNNTFCEKLENEINRFNSNEVEVVNSGVVGYGPDQALLKLIYDYTKLKPDMIVFSIYSGNDFGDLLRNKIFNYDPDSSAFEINYSDTTDFLSVAQVKNKSNASVIPIMSYSDINDYQLEGTLKDCLTKNADPAGFRKLNLVRYIETRLNPNSCERYNYDEINGSNYVSWSLNLCYEELRDYISDHHTVKELFNDHYDADISLFPESESALYKINLMNIVFRELFSFCSSQKLKVMVLIIPSKIDLCKDGYFKLDRNKYINFKSQRLSLLVESIARLNHLECLNLLSYFSSGDPSNYYFKGMNDHWNDAGQKYAANIVAKLIADKIKN